MKIMTKEEKNYVKRLESMIDERDEYIKELKESARRTFKLWREVDERNNTIIYDYRDIIYNAFLNMSRLLDRDIVDAVIDSCIDTSYFRDNIKEMIDYDQTVNRLKNYEEYEKIMEERSNEKFFPNEFIKKKLKNYEEYKEIMKERSNEKFLDEFIRKTDYSDIFEGHDSDYEDFEDYNDLKNRELMIAKAMKAKGCPWPPIYVSYKKKNKKTLPFIQKEQF